MRTALRIKYFEIRNRKYLKANKMLHDKSKGKDIALLRLDRVGDFIIWLDSVRAYKNLFPAEKIVLICNECNKELAVRLDLFDEVITISMEKFLKNDSYKKEIEKKFEGSSYRILIQTEYSRTIGMDMLAAMIPAVEKVAMEADESRDNSGRYGFSQSTKTMADAIYSQLIISVKKWEMELIRNADFVRGLGEREFKSRVFNFPILEKQVEIPKEEYFIVFPGANGVEKQWSPENFAYITQYILKKTDYLGMICGVEKEQKLAEKITNGIDERDRHRIIDKTGKSTLPQLVELIRNASLVITNDTSGVHIAVATKTPSVCIMGEHSIERFLPYQLEEENNLIFAPIIVRAGMPCAKCVNKRTMQCRWSMRKNGQFLCIKNICVSQVKEAVESVLESINNKER